MKYDFDKVVDRHGTNCLKYDFAIERGKPADILPLWVADMDFQTAPAILERLDEPEMEAEPEAPKRIGHALGAVEFSHVRFGQLLVNRHFVSFIHSFL